MTGTRRARIVAGRFGDTWHRELGGKLGSRAVIGGLLALAALIAIVAPGGASGGDDASTPYLTRQLSIMAPAAARVLPGIGPALTIALLLPITFNFSDPVGAFILFAGIYAGGMYGGSTTSSRLNTRGESSSVGTAIEGFEMAKRGRGRSALATAAIGSFVAGTIGIVALTLLARGALTASGDDFGVFFGRPLTVILLIVAAAAFIVPHLGALRGPSFSGED